MLTILASPTGFPFRGRSHRPSSGAVLLSGLARIVPPCRPASLQCEDMRFAMTPSREDRIRQRAYEIWRRDGEPSGREEENWSRAVREIDDEDHHARRAEAPRVRRRPPDETGRDADLSDRDKALRAAEAAARRHGFDLAELLHPRTPRAGIRSRRRQP
ncbi:DUF2934 domain-containing protein [Limimaricola variabilis]|uniref:DUF2934 domain-containing protein n=1 Tax=Limimaricola variabilis TaxID=1492771 RepID=UPI003CCCE85E